MSDYSQPPCKENDRGHRERHPDFVIIDAGQELWQALESVWALRVEEWHEVPFIIVHADENPSDNDLAYLNEAILPLSTYGCFTAKEMERMQSVIQRLTQKAEQQLPVPADPRQPVSSRRTRGRKPPATQQPWWASYSPSLNAIRYTMVLAIAFLVALSAVSAMFFPTGVVVFEKILPILTLSAGYLFGRQGDHETASV